MSKLASLLGTNTAVSLGAAAVLVAGGVGVYFKDVLIGTPEVPQAEAPMSGAPETESVQTDQQSAAMPVQEGGAVAPAVSSQEASLSAPAFDIVRVDPDGRLTIAGEAPAGQAVELLLDGDVLATLLAGADGSFVHLGDLPASETARVLSLRMTDSGETGQSEFLVAPLRAAEAAAPDAVVASNAVASSDTVEPQKQQAVVEISKAGVEVVQSASPQVMSEVALDAISYSDVGDVQLAGRAPSEGFVRIYLDNKPVTTQPVAQSGQWRTELPDVDSGIYTLRVDKVDASGAVTSRVETPFKREPAGKVQEAKVSAVTVQPGTTLWAIAAERFGNGLMYVQLYEANKDQIRNPDLIYPGQVFDIPG